MNDSLTTSLALIFTDAQGQIVFLDNNFLEMSAADDAGELVGEPLHTVLGIDYDFAHDLVESIAQAGYAREQLITLRKQDNTVRDVKVSGAASYDDSGAFIGIDLTIKDSSNGTAQTEPLQHDDVLGTYIKQMQTEAENSSSDSEQVLIHLYVIAQLQAIEILLARMAGPRIRQAFQGQVKKITEKNDIYLSVMPEYSDELPLDAYRELLNKPVKYASNVIGQRMVLREMQSVDEQVTSQALDLVREYGLLYTN